MGPPSLRESLSSLHPPWARGVSEALQSPLALEWVRLLSWLAEEQSGEAGARSAEALRT